MIKNYFKHIELTCYTV